MLAVDVEPGTVVARYYTAEKLVPVNYVRLFNVLAGPNVMYMGTKHCAEITAAEWLRLDRELDEVSRAGFYGMEHVIEHTQFFDGKNLCHLYMPPEEVKKIPPSLLEYVAIVDDSRIFEIYDDE